MNNFKLELISKIIKENYNLSQQNGKCIGFDFNGIFITDPNLDETGRFSVNPLEYYGKANIEKFIDDGKHLIK